jgi:hypothetical protein
VHESSVAFVRLERRFTEAERTAERRQVACFSASLSIERVIKALPIKESRHDDDDCHHPNNPHNP